MDRPRLMRAARAAACAYFVYHLAAITMANVPRTTALGAGFHRLFDAYIHATGIWQRWDMFTTIPYFRDLDVRLTARDASGRDLRYGPMLPELSPFDKRLRLQALFARLTFWRASYAPFAARYFARACDAVEAKTGQRPAKVGIELVADKIRPLAFVRADGVVSERETLRFEEAPCP